MALAASLEGRSILDQHDDPPVEVGAPVADAQRGRGDGEAAAGQGHEVRRVVFGLGGLLGGAGVGQVILAEAELAAQPPEQGLVEEEEAGEGRQIPAADIAALGVRPFVGETVAQGRSIGGPAQLTRQQDEQLPINATVLYK